MLHSPSVSVYIAALAVASFNKDTDKIQKGANSQSYHVVHQSIQLENEDILVYYAHDWDLQKYPL